MTATYEAQWVNQSAMRKKGNNKFDCRFNTAFLKEDLVDQVYKKSAI